LKFPIKDASQAFDGVCIPGFPKGSLPKITSELRDASIPWEKHLRAKGAAVSVLFIPPQSSQSEISRLVLTVRSVQVRRHKGQIAFAGGKIDDSDISPGDTAIRELWEEIGVAPEAVQLWGALPAIAALDGSPIVPVLMTAAIDDDGFCLCDDEVAELILLPWTHLTNSVNRRFRFNLFGNWRESDQFIYQHHVIWGLTAKIIAELQLS
jgi:8-oxo-dGTP pyrophosphatase MutT (NUDIX family)